MSDLGQPWFTACFGLVRPRPGRPPEPAVTARTELWRLRFSVRARKAFGRLNVQTVGDLAARTAGDILAVHNVGVSTLTEIRTKLAAKGFHLAGDEWP